MKKAVGKDLFRFISCLLTMFLVLSVCMYGTAIDAGAQSYYAEDIVKYAVSKVGTSASSNTCMGWVNGAFKSVYGWERQGCCGYTYGSRVRESTSQDNIPLGAIVYFQYTDQYSYGKVYDSACGNYAGHVGIYVGDGMMVHTFDWADGKGTRVCKDKITRVAKPSLYKYCGWGWYNKTKLVKKSDTAASEPAAPAPTPAPAPAPETPKTAVIKLDASGGSMSGTDSYSSWGPVKTTTKKPVESDTLRITDTASNTKYKYFHYHNSYEGTQMMIDSISYTGNWGYCEMTKDSRITSTRSFQDKGGRSSVSVGDKCKYGYTYWFEDKITSTVYSYQERTLTGTGSTIEIGTDGIIPLLPSAEKADSTFVCWNTSPDGSGKAYYPGKNVSFGSFSAGGSYTLYAIYESDIRESIPEPEPEPELTPEPEPEPEEEAEEVSSGKGTIMLTIGSPVIWVGDSARNIDQEGTAPLIRDSRTLLPVRAVVEAMGGSVGWDGSSQTVSMKKDGKTLSMKIGSRIVTDSRGSTMVIDCEPQIINNRTMLPIRFVAEYFGASVTWNADTRTISIKYQ